MIVTEVSQNKSRQLAFIIPETCYQGFDEAVITFVTIADLRHKHTETMLYNGQNGRLFFRGSVFVHLVHQVHQVHKMRRIANSGTNRRRGKFKSTMQAVSVFLSISGFSSEFKQSNLIFPAGACIFQGILVFLLKGSDICCLTYPKTDGHGKKIVSVFLQVC